VNPEISIKVQINRVVNLLLWLSTCLMTATGFMLAFRLPPGSRGGGGLTAWGWSRHEWGDLHLRNGYVFLILVILHLILHWRWFWCMTSKWFKIFFLAGLIAGLLVVGAGWLIPVEHTSEDGHRQGSGQGHGHERGNYVKPSVK